MNKENIKLWASIATIIGTCIAAIALIPAFVPLFRAPETVQYVTAPESNSPSVNSENSQSQYFSYVFPDTPNNPPVTFFNEWVNINSQTDSLKRVSIKASNGSTYINMFGACTQSECDFLDYSPTPTLKYNYDSEAQILHVEWTFDFEIMKQELTIMPDGQLKVVSHEHFVDNSGRLDYESVEYFTRQ